MAIWHKRSLKKKTGGKTRRYRKNKRHERGSQFTEPEIGEERKEKSRTRGGNTKTRAKRSQKVNLAVNGEVKSVEIESVENNPANPNYVRRSLLTKGTIIETSEGKAEITSRPGQQGALNAKTIEE